MKTKSWFIALFALLSFFGNRAHAQTGTTYFHKTGPGWWTFGIDGGMAYQSSDVRSTYNGWGGGLTLGKNLAYRPGGLLSFDMRGRLLLDRSYGANNRRSTGLKFNNALNGYYSSNPNYLLDTDATIDSSFVFANHRTTMFEGGLEGVLTLNRLRERTGVVVNFFGGVGLDWHYSDIDQADASGNNYFDKYLTVNQFGNRRDNLAALRGIRDGSFETTADGYGKGLGKIGIMPGLGIEVGFQVTPRFVIGLGHKATFSRTDILDGHQWRDNNTATAKNDIAHYTNLHLRWDIGPKKKREKEPEITITEPGDNPHETISGNLFVRANIKNVNSAADVTARLNGREIPFRFSNPKFGANLPLFPGRNELVIHASNLAGDDSETLIIFYKNPAAPPTFPPTPPPNTPPTTRLRPEVQFTNPARSPYSTERDQVFVTASVKNVNSKRDLRFFVNGKEESRFTFAEGFEANVGLREGRNTLRLEAENSNGSASDEVVIEVDLPILVEKPAVSIEILPKKNNPCGKIVTAQIQRVEEKSDITVFFNNRETREWSWDSRRGIVTCEFELQPGRNFVRIRATNRGGSAEDEKTIECLDKPVPPTPQKPKVTITEPTNGRKFSVKKATLVGRVEEVADRSKISVSVNNQSVRNFEFDKTNGEIRADIELASGENLLKISATNADGSDEATVRVSYSGINMPPVVDFISPKNGSSTEQNRADVEATIANVTQNSGIEFLVNGASGPRFSFSNGKLTATANLRDGENTITVRATNVDGSDEKTVKIRLEKAKIPPVVDIISPKNGAVTDKNEAAIEAKILNLTSATGAFLSVNGTKVNRFQFLDGKLTGLVSLREGENTVAVRGTNEGGSDEKSIRIVYKPTKATPAPAPALPPSVIFTFPEKPEVKTTKSVEILKFSTQNVENANQITVSTGRGTPLTGLKFDPKTGKGSIEVKLSNGSNIFRVTVTTADGTATDETKLDFSTVKPGKSTAKPTVEITSVTPPIENTATVFAKTTGILTRDGVAVTINGTDFTAFSFDEKSGIVKAVVPVIRGENKVVVRVENGRDSAEAERAIRY